MTQADLARKHGIKPSTLSSCKRRFDITAEEAVQIVLAQRAHVSLAQKCRDAGIDRRGYQRATHYQSVYGLTNEEAMKRATERRVTLKERCEVESLSYRRALNMRKRGLSDDAIIEKLKTPQKTIMDMCKEAGVNSNSVYHLRSREGLTAEQAIARLKASRNA
jgi:lambda repressor-like predicted transcriptional regulator